MKLGHYRCSKGGTLTSTIPRGVLPILPTPFDADESLLQFEFQPGLALAVRKEIFRRRGLLSTTTTRHPGPVLDAATVAALDRLLAHLELDPAATWSAAT